MSHATFPYGFQWKLNGIESMKLSWRLDVAVRPWIVVASRSRNVQPLPYLSSIQTDSINLTIDQQTARNTELVQSTGAPKSLWLLVGTDIMESFGTGMLSTCWLPKNGYAGKKVDRGMVFCLTTDEYTCVSNDSIVAFLLQTCGRVARLPSSMFPLDLQIPQSTEAAVSEPLTANGTSSPRQGGF